MKVLVVPILFRAHGRITKVEIIQASALLKKAKMLRVVLLIQRDLQPLNMSKIIIITENNGSKKSK